MKKIDAHGYLFILPFFLVFAVFTAYPIVNTLVTSFTDESLSSFDPPLFLGLDNYWAEVTSPLFWKAFFNTWAIWLPNIVLQLFLALVVSAVLTSPSLRLRGKSLFRAIYFFPNMVAVTTIAVLVYALFDWQGGVVNQLIHGSDKSTYTNWFGSGSNNQAIIAGVQTWIWFGYTAITLMAGIDAISMDLYEAAALDGASGWQVYVKVVLPSIRPVLLYVLVTSLIGGLQMFDLPWVMFPGGQGGADQGAVTLSVYMYARAFAWDQNLGAGSAVAWIVFVLVALFSALLIRVAYGRQNGEEDLR